MIASWSASARHRAEDGVAHDHRRVGRVQHDDRLAAVAPPSLATARAVVRVNSSMLARVPGPAERGDRGDDLGVVDRRTRDTACTIGMVAWPPQVTMLTFGSVEVLVEVRRRHDVGADRGRGQVDGPDAGLGVERGVGGGARRPTVASKTRSGRVLGEQPVDAVGRRLAGRAARPAASRRCRVDADHPARLDQRPSAAACTSGRCRCCRIRRSPRSAWPGAYSASTGAAEEGPAFQRTGRAVASDAA